ncbi:mitochondrial genome maintenance MGM101 [Xylaria nigripes]|nr:mitochondrial genome maintenance MGM101 [Xylaria nigripes]
MASRTVAPLRAASQYMNLVPRGARYVLATPWTTSTAKYSQSFSSASKPPASPQSGATSAVASVASRKPIPAVSGEPLPDAPLSSKSNTNTGYGDTLSDNSANDGQINWTNSFHGLGTSSFAPETAALLQAPVNPGDVEVKPDGIIYLPEIKYRRILNAAFGPGGWGLAPRGELMVQERLVTREYALVVHGRFVGQARGEQQYFSEDGVSTAAEGCKSNALMRCCKDLGIASELWDPRFIRKFMKEHALQVWVEHVTLKKRKQIWMRKDDEVRYPFKKV